MASTPEPTVTTPPEIPADRPRPRRWRRRLVRAGIVLLVLLVAVVLLTPTLVNAFVRPAVVSTLAENLNGEPAIDHLSFSWFSGVEVSGIRIANPPGFSDGPCLTVDRATVDVSLLSLVGGKVVLAAPLHVSTVRVNVEQNAAGETNLALLAKPRPARSPDEKAPREKAPRGEAPDDAGGPLPHVEAALLVEDVVVSVRTPALDEPAVLSPLRVESRVDTLDRPLTFRIASADDALAVDGSLRVARDGKLDVPGLTGEVAWTIRPELLAPLEPLLAAIGPLDGFEGSVAGEGRVAFEGLAKPAGRIDLTVDLGRLGIGERTLRPGTVTAALVLEPRDGGATGIDARITSPAVSLGFAGRLTADSSRVSVSGEPSFSLDVAEGAARFPGLFSAERELEGRLSGAVKGFEFAAVLAEGAAPQTALSGAVEIRGEGLTEAGPDGRSAIFTDATVELAFDVDTAEGRYRLEGLAVRLDDLLTARGRILAEGIALPAGGEEADADAMMKGAALGADLSAAADLGELLARARRFTDLLPPELALEGRIDGRIRISPAEPGTRVYPVAIEAGVKALRVSGLAALEGIEPPREIRATVEGGIDLAGDGRATLSKATIESSLVTATATGEARGLRRRPEGDLTLDVEADTGAVADAIAGKLGDVRLGGSPLSMTVRAGGGADGGTFDARVEVPALDLDGLPGPAARVVVRQAGFRCSGSGADGWRRLELDEARFEAALSPGDDVAPAKVAFAARGAGNLESATFEARDVEVSMPGARLAAEGSRSGDGVRATADLTAEIAPLLDLARTWNLPVEDLAGTGSVALRIEADGPLERVTVRKLRLAEREIGLSGASVPPQVRWPVSASQELALVVNALDPTAPVEILSGSVVGPGLGIDEIRGRVDARGAGNDVTAAGTLDPEALVAAAPGFLGDTELSSGAGPLSLTFRGSLGSPEIAFDLSLPETKLRGTELPPAGIDLGRPTARVRARLDLEAGSLDLTEAAIETGMLTANARASVARDESGGFERLEGRASGRASLPAIRELAVAFGAVPADAKLDGDVTFEAGVEAADGDRFPFTAEVRTPSLAVRWPLEREGRPPAVLELDEPEGAVILAGTFANTASGFEVTIDDPSAVDFRIARGPLRGKIVRTATGTAAPSLEAEGLTAELTYDPERLAPILAALDAGGFTVNESQSVTLALNGPLLPGDDLRAWLAGFGCDASVGFGGFANRTVRVEGKPLPVDLKSGRLPIDYACTVNGGAVALEGLVDTQGDGTRMKMSAREVAVNADMAPALAFLNPILSVGRGGSLEGRVSLEIDGSWSGLLPVDAGGAGITEQIGRYASARGRFSAVDLKITGSPLLSDLVVKLLDDEGGEIARIDPTEFRLKNGVLKIDSMNTRIGKVDLVISGRIRVDQTLDLTIVAPVPKAVRRSNKSLRKYFGATFEIPLKGSVTSPRLDYQKAVRLLLEEAGKAALKDKARGILGGLLDGGR